MGLPACSLEAPKASNSSNGRFAPVPVVGSSPESFSTPLGVSSSLPSSGAHLVPSSLGCRAPLWRPLHAASGSEEELLEPKEKTNQEGREERGKNGEARVHETESDGTSQALGRAFASGSENCQEESGEVPMPRLGELFESLPTPAFSLSTQRGLPQCLLAPHLRRELSTVRLLDIPAGEALLLQPVYEQWWKSVGASELCEDAAGGAMPEKARLCRRCLEEEEGMPKRGRVSSGTEPSSSESSPLAGLSPAGPSLHEGSSCQLGLPPEEEEAGERAACEADSDAHSAKRRRLLSVDGSSAPSRTCERGASPRSPELGEKTEVAETFRESASPTDLQVACPSRASSASIPPRATLPVCDLAGFALHLMARDLQSAESIYPVNQKSAQRGGEKAQGHALARVGVGSSAGRQTLDARKLMSLAVCMQAHIVTAPSEELKVGSTTKAETTESVETAMTDAKSEGARGLERLERLETEDDERALHRLASKREVRMIRHAEILLQEAVEELRSELRKKEKGCCSACGRQMDARFFFLVHGEQKDGDTQAVAPPALPHLLANLQGGSDPQLRQCVGRRLAAVLTADVSSSADGSSPPCESRASPEPSLSSARPASFPRAAFVSGVSVGGLGYGESLSERRKLFAASINSAPLFRQPTSVRFLPLHRGGPLELLHAFCCGADVIQGGETSEHAERGIAYSFDPYDLLQDEEEEGESAGQNGGEKDVEKLGRRGEAISREADARAAQEMLERAAAAGMASRLLHLDLTSEVYRDDFRPIMEKRSRGISRATDCLSSRNCGGSEASKDEETRASQRGKEGASCRWSTVQDSRAYIHHLFNCSELMGPVLLLHHNLQCLLALFEVFRIFLRRGELRVAVHRFLRRCCEKGAGGQTRPVALSKDRKLSLASLPRGEAHGNCRAITA
ncbi:queuine tRNA-ribosyltransferase [Toxoplasma gondii MAS]|uniref:Queuine tRNA-ribosyltransferase n=2 Tax=Toxoplasma gondii TaxID=5811 RepID=A0A086PZI6_TOXGO|nr:queuine tRNA-ribosyltransferase [Toxoplasma gondii MAS]PUA90415.1 queuine tRNA-ribosyltransferase [Toxoplasma gondii TgCATBr9]